MRWSLTARLRLGLVVAWLCGLTSAAAIWWVALDYRNQLGHAYGTHLSGRAHLVDVSPGLWHLHQGMLEFRTGSPEDRQRVLGAADQWYAFLEGRLDSYEGTTHDAEERRGLAGVRAVYERFKQAQATAFALWRAGDEEEAIAGQSQAAMRLNTETARAVDAQLALQRAVSAREQSRSERRVRVGIALATAVTTALLALLVAGYWLVVRALRPIRALRAEAVALMREGLGEDMPDHTGDNEVAALTSGVRLLTGRLLAHAEEVRRAGERTETLLRASPAVIYSAMAQGNYGATFISANVREQLGHAPEDFLNDPDFWANNIHPDDRAQVFGHQALVLTEGRITCEYRFRRKDGSWRWMHDQTNLVRDEAGAPKELVGSWIDISMRRQLEEALEESEAAYRAVVDAALDAIVINDDRGWVTDLNPAAERLFGYPRDQAVGMALAELLIPVGDGGALRELFRKSLELGRPAFGGRRTEVTGLRADGSEVPIEIAIQRLDRGGQVSLVAFVRDLSAERRVTQELGRLSRLQAEFMANVTHELRTPLHAVLGFAGLLKDEVPGPLNAKQVAFVADIVAAGERLLRLVEGILEMSRVSLGKEGVAREPVDIRVALTERVAAHRELAEARRLTLTLEVGNDTHSAEVDPRALRRMVDVLLDNAIRFNREGGTVTVRARHKAGWLEIAVADTGVGIARHDLGRLFQPLVQLDWGRGPQPEGIGLGLMLAQRLAEAHGGVIEVASEPGQGSTFTLRIPRGEAA